MTTDEMTFEQFDKQVGNHKTGWLKGESIDMYTRRTGERERVFRVSYPERNSKYPTHEDYAKAQKRAQKMWRMGIQTEYVNEFVWKQQLFPYSAKGLEMARTFNETVAEPIREAVRLEAMDD